MGHILCQIASPGPDPLAQYGDVVQGATTCAAEIKNAGRICSVRRAGFTSDGLRPIGSLAEMFLWRTRQWMNRRVSRTEVIRRCIVTGEEARYGPESISLDSYLRQRVRHHSHQIFGVPGAEYWFSGPSTHQFVDVIWDSISSATGLSRSDHGRYPLTPVELRRFLAIGIPESVTLDEISEATEPELDGDPALALEDTSAAPEVIRKHRGWVDFSTLDVDLGHVKDLCCACDLRDIEVPWATLVKIKTPLAGP